MKQASSILKSGRRLAVVVCATMAPFSMAHAVKNMLGLENPEYPPKVAAAQAPSTLPSMNCPVIRILGNTIPDCPSRGAQGPVRSDEMQSAKWDIQRDEIFLGGAKTP